jgi:hypothetical protein
MDTIKNLAADVENVPDLRYVVDTMTQIFTIITTDRMIELKKNNRDQYEQELHDQFKDFCDKHYSLFSVILDGELDSMTHLVMMIKTLCLVKSGQITMDTAYAHIREELSNHYIYPQFGGKKGFEKAIKDRSRNKKTKQ